MIRAVFILSLCISVVFSLGRLGEVQKVSGNDRQVQNAIVFAMNELNSMSNNYYRYMAIKTLDATKQVVQGMKCCVVVAVGSSSKCPNSVQNWSATLKQCPVEKKEMECGFVVWEQVWLADPNKLIEHKCSSDSHLICSGGSVKIKNSILEDEFDANEMSY